jgi:hypothetical protein
MGSFRFYHRVRVFPGLSVNLSRSGPSLSVGVRGAHVTVGRRGVTTGIPTVLGRAFTIRRGPATTPGAFGVSGRPGRMLLPLVHIVTLPLTLPPRLGGGDCVVLAAQSVS